MVRTPNGMRYREIFDRHPDNPIITVADIL
jgi:hypothetical protein